MKTTFFACDGNRVPPAERDVGTKENLGVHKTADQRHDCVFLFKKMLVDEDVERTESNRRSVIWLKTLLLSSTAFLPFSLNMDDWLLCSLYTAKLHSKERDNCLCLCASVKQFVQC